MAALQKLYVDNLYPSKTAFLKIAKQAGYDKKAVEAFLEKKNEQVVFKKITLPEGHYNHDAYDAACMADLMDLTKYSRKNNGYKFILNVLEWKSRYAWSFPLKTKTPVEVAPYLEQVFNELSEQLKTPINLMFIRLIVDQGSEFKGAVNTLLKKYGVMKLEGIPKVRRSAGPVERFNGTLLKMMSRMMVAQGSEKWVDELPKLVKIYNNRIHTGIKMKPVDAFKKLEKGSLDLDKMPKERFKVDDVVRIVQAVDIFDKKTTTEKVSLETYKVVRYEGSMVVIKDKNNDEIKVVENQLVKSVEAEGDAENFQKERRERVVQNRKNRASRKHINTIHEGYVDEETGSAKLKARNLPTGGAPKRPKVGNVRLRDYVLE